MTRNMKNYFIKPGYIHKEGNTTLDAHREENYLSKEKVALPRFHQRDVCRFGKTEVTE
jgi:hypothetical protein